MSPPTFQLDGATRLSGHCSQSPPHQVSAPVAGHTRPSSSQDTTGKVRHILCTCVCSEFTLLWDQDEANSSVSLIGAENKQVMTSSSATCPRRPMIFDGVNYTEFVAHMRIHMRGLRLWSFFWSSRCRSLLPLWSLHHHHCH